MAAKMMYCQAGLLDVTVCYVANVTVLKIYSSLSAVAKELNNYTKLCYWIKIHCMMGLCGEIVAFIILHGVRKTGKYLVAHAHFRFKAEVRNFQLQVGNNYLASSLMMYIHFGM